MFPLNSSYISEMKLSVNCSEDSPVFPSQLVSTTTKDLKNYLAWAPRPMAYLAWAPSSIHGLPCLSHHPRG